MVPPPPLPPISMNRRLGTSLNSTTSASLPSSSSAPSLNQVTTKTPVAADAAAGTSKKVDSLTSQYFNISTTTTTTATTQPSRAPTKTTTTTTAAAAVFASVSAPAVATTKTTTATTSKTTIATTGTKNIDTVVPPVFSSSSGTAATTNRFFPSTPTGAAVIARASARRRQRSGVVGGGGATTPLRIPPVAVPKATTAGTKLSIDTFTTTTKGTASKRLQEFDEDLHVSPQSPSTTDDTANLISSKASEETIITTNKRHHRNDPKSNSTGVEYNKNINQNVKSDEQVKPDTLSLLPSNSGLGKSLESLPSSVPHVPRVAFRVHNPDLDENNNTDTKAFSAMERKRLHQVSLTKSKQDRYDNPTMERSTSPTAAVVGGLRSSLRNKITTTVATKSPLHQTVNISKDKDSPHIENKYVERETLTSNQILNFQRASQNMTILTNQQALHPSGITSSIVYDESDNDEEEINFQSSCGNQIDFSDEDDVVVGNQRTIEDLDIMTTSRTTTTKNDFYHVSDVTCIGHQSMLMIKSHFSGRTLQDTDVIPMSSSMYSSPNDTNNFIDCEGQGDLTELTSATKLNRRRKSKGGSVVCALGLSLGDAKETFSLLVVSSNRKQRSFSSSNRTEGNDTYSLSTKNILRYGDRVVLRISTSIKTTAQSNSNFGISPTIQPPINSSHSSHTLTESSNCMTQTKILGVRTTDQGQAFTHDNNNTRINYNHDGADKTMMEQKYVRPNLRKHIVELLSISQFEDEDGIVNYHDSLDQWMVLPYHPVVPVLVGSGAVRRCEKSDNQFRNIERETGIPVKSNDPVLLRHYRTGGILSCYIPEETLLDNNSEQPPFRLRIITDSYDVNHVRHKIPSTDSNGTITSIDLLSRLQQSNVLVATVQEVFYLVPSTNPPTPLWMTPINTKITTQNCFSEESYSNTSGLGPIRSSLTSLRNSFLFHQFETDQLLNHASKQNDMLNSASIERPRQFLQYHSDILLQARNQQLQSIRGQEKILIDEIMGSLIGIEGEYIKTVNIPLPDNPLLPVEYRLQHDPSSSTVPTFDLIICNLVKEILSLSTSFVRVRHFLFQHYPGYDYGSVMQGMCESIDFLLQDYMNNTLLVIEQYRRKCDQQSQESLTIWNLFTKLRHALHEMQVLEQVCVKTFKEKGGSLINALGRLKSRVYRGDHAAEKILERLLEAASGPYMILLTRWLKYGELTDPYGEFMIAINPTKHADDSNESRLLSETWESEYSLVPSNVLEGFFATGLTVEQVLATGRYWNALRSCSAEHSIVKSSEHDKSQTGDWIPTYFSSVATVSSYVLNLYQEASSEILRLLMIDYDIVGSLRLMKRYFLLEHGDFFVNFLDVAECELHKDLTQISRGRVQHWLNVAVQLTERTPELAERIIVSSTTLRDIKYRGESNKQFSSGRLTAPARLRCRFALLSLTEYLDKIHASTGGIDTNEPWTPLRHTYSSGKIDTSIARAGDGLSGLETFVLEFATIPFPVSLVLSARAVAEYQLLFRHLFFAKHVERRLVSIWQDHQFMKELQSLRGTMGPTFLLRQRMLHFLQNLIYYMMFEVIEPNWLQMETTISHAKLRNATSKTKQTVDDILKAHNHFLQRALEACLLTNRELIRALTKLMRTCLLFTDQMKRFLKATKIEDDRINVADEMQKVVQRNLNDRRSSIEHLRNQNKFPDTAEQTRKQLRDQMQKARQERQQRVQRQTIRVQREVSSESYQRMVRRFEEVFSDNLREFMLLLAQSDDSFHTHKVNLCIRLDYNGYVGRTLK